MENDRILKYRIAWYIGIVISFLLYFSGIIFLYVLLRKKYLKQHNTIVIMYHRVGDVIEGSEDPDMFVSNEDFEKQISYLAKNYDVISLDELLNRYRHGCKIEKDSITITFDDGFKDNYVNAFPILKKYKLPAAIFIITGLVDRDPEMLNREEILIMDRDQITFGAHTRTHKILSKLDREHALKEVKGSKDDLEEILQKEIKYFVYPKGKKQDFTEESMQIVKEAGFNAAFSTENGCIDSKSNIYAFNRMGMRGYPLFVIKARLSGIFESKWIYVLRKYSGLT